MCAKAGNKKSITSHFTSSIRLYLRALQVIYDKLGPDLI